MEVKESVHMSIDDYLDLLNYAKAINDRQWQADIIVSLKNFKAVSDVDRQDQNKSVIELWTHFDAINVLIMELLDKLRKHKHSEEQQQWREQLWALKMERNIVSKKILNRYIKIK